MVIASIDVQGGKVVQLKQGDELVLARDNAKELAAEFNRYGEVAVIDLDAAMNKGSNDELIKPLLRIAECRVGGGIKTVERAKELISFGAKKVIIGSTAFRVGDKFAVNTEFLEALAKKIGKERIIVAVDARNGEIVVDGWKTSTGINLIDGAKLVEPFVSEILFTCVEREGMMSGTDLNQVKLLREAVTCTITAAGGITTIDEVEEVSALGCDVQIGMALYTGKINLAESFLRSLNWKKETLLPVIAQAEDGQVLMTGFADKEAVAETFARGKLCFHSRSRNRLWMKGESSGNTLDIIKLRTDCDQDAILATVKPNGPVCHTGKYSCFAADKQYSWEYLQEIITERFRNPAPGSYTASLDDELVREKVQEEAEEICTAKTHDEVVWEAADLLYFMTVLMTREKVSVQEVFDELDRRHKK
jgi:phosphoribosyl-ATP pyrophosphohydrolase/phosphoribosyl-AMP cyclohydrolase